MAPTSNAGRQKQDAAKAGCVAENPPAWFNPRTRVVENKDCVVLSPRLRGPKPRTRVVDNPKPRGLGARVIDRKFARERPVCMGGFEVYVILFLL